jgi:hypothetical protein
MNDLSRWEKLWFIVLGVSILTGIGMTVFAPV